MARGVKPGLSRLICILCNEEFQAKTSWQKFCSRKCEQRNVANVNPKSKRKAFKNWLANKLRTNPDFYKDEYRKRKKDYKKFLEQRRRWSKNSYRKSRLKVLNYYGGQCICCGENKYEFLAIDHTNGGGSKQRKELKGKVSSMFRWIIQNGYPKEFRVLCHNCNQSLGYYGYCPHKKL